jgi:hypothetical protein
MKQCTKCNETKSLSEYTKRADTKDGYQYQCKACVREHYVTWKDGSFGKSYLEKTKEKKRIYQKQYLKENKDKLKEYRRRPETKVRKSSSNKKYYFKNKEKIKEYIKSWKAENKDKSNVHRRKWKRNRYATDPVFKLKELISSSVRDGLKKNYSVKNNPTWQTLPYTPEQLKEHLESQFDEHMDWDNHGTYWHIDHIVPQAALPYASMDHPNFQLCWTLNNLQPLKAQENLKKSSFYQGRRHFYSLTS